MNTSTNTAPAPYFSELDRKAMRAAGLSDADIADAERMATIYGARLAAGEYPRRTLAVA